MTRHAKKTEAAASAPIEFCDTWTTRETRVTAQYGEPKAGGQLTAMIRTATEEARPTFKLTLEWVRYVGGAAMFSREKQDIELDLELVDALVAVLPRLVEQARADGTLPPAPQS